MTGIQVLAAKTWMAGPSPRRRGFGPAGGTSPATTKSGSFQPVRKFPKRWCFFGQAPRNPDHYATFTARRYHSSMIKTYCNAVMAFVVLSLLDRYLCGGHYTGVAHAILRQIGHG